MSTLTYGTTSIPSDNYEVIPGGTVQVSAAFERTVGIVGGMDTDNGTATPGDVVEVTSVTDAQEKFGEGSELHEQIRLIYANGASEVNAIPVSETETTESFTAASSGTLSNTPVFDPNIHDEHEITATDEGEAGVVVDVNIVYETGVDIATPSGSNEINLNPNTGEWEADSSSDYDITYTYGDYSSSVVTDLSDEGDRIVAVCTESESVVTDVDTAVQDNATDFSFQHIVAGAAPVPDPTDTATYATNYSDGLDTERVSVISPARGYIDDAETDEQRTIGAVAGYLSSLPLGLSSTNDSLTGLTGLRADYSFSQAGDLIDAQVIPLIDYPPVTIVKDMTTSTEPKFERVYAMQILDEVTSLSHDVSKVFTGGQNSDSQRSQLSRSHRNFLRALRDDAPPLLEDFTVNVVEVDDTTVDVELGVDIIGVMDTINVKINVGDILRAETE